MKWHREAVGVYASDLCRVLRDTDGWTVFRPAEPGPSINESGFPTLDGAKRWAEKHVPGILAEAAKPRQARLA